MDASADGPVAGVRSRTPAGRLVLPAAIHTGTGPVAGHRHDAAANSLPTRFRLASVPLLIHQLETILAALAGLYGFLDRKAAELRATEALMKGSEPLRGVLNHRQMSLIRHAFRHPGALYTIETHRRSHDTVYQTARADLMALADLGLLERRKAGRAFAFAVPGDLPDRLGRSDSVLTPPPGASPLSSPRVRKQATMPVATSTRR